MKYHLSWILILTFYGGLAVAEEAPIEVTGYSGKDVQLEAPTNLTLLLVIGSTALLSWNPVQSDRGNYEGYKIKIWSDASPEPREVQIHNSFILASVAKIGKLDTSSKNYVQLYVYNGTRNGPPSEVLSFYTSDKIREPVKNFEAYPLGPTGFLLKWEKPEKPYGVLIGYDIYWSKLTADSLDVYTPRKPQIRPGNITHAKLAGLEPNTTYSIYITAITNRGGTVNNYIERTTSGHQSNGKPSKPNFNWEIVSADPPVSVRVVWLPAEDDAGGSNFFVQYRKKGQLAWSHPHHEKFEDWIIITGLEESGLYDFVVASTNGMSSELATKSDIKEVRT